jgi:hypothetical protein
VTFPKLTRGDSLHYDEATAAVDALAAADVGDDAVTFATATLDFLTEQRDILRKRIGEYPGNAVNAKDWLDGVGLGHQAVRLGDLLMDWGRFDLEERARDLAVNIGCIVEGHYHHVIGPRMVQAIRCADRLGKIARVRALCDAVVADFTWILEERLDDEDDLSPEEAYSIWSLQVALQREAELDDPPQRRYDAAVAAHVLERAPRG